MKMLLLPLIALSLPFSAQAATNVSCRSLFIQFDLSAPEGIERVGSALDVHAVGVLDTLIKTQIENVELRDNRLVIRVAEVGTEAPFQLKGDIYLDVVRDGDRLLPGQNGRIVVTDGRKTGDGGLIIQSEYLLTNCSGTL